MGQRIAKHVYDENFQLQKSTYYILDASGNVMATYDKEINYAESKTYFKLKERHIYGSSRVGVRNSELDVLPLPDKNFSMTTVHYSIGSRTYELSNHLGNVLSVISDTAEGSHEVNVIPVFPYSNVISEMRADIRVAQDYSPFGVTLDGRNFVVSEGYRYSFQGQEHDDEIKGAGNSVNYKYRMHDPRIGRFFAVDPLIAKYAHYSSYSFSGNKVLMCIELEGAEEFFVNIFNPLMVYWNIFGRAHDRAKGAGPQIMFLTQNSVGNKQTITRPLVESETAGTSLGGPVRIDAQRRGAVSNASSLDTRIVDVDGPGVNQPYDVVQYTNGGGLPGVFSATGIWPPNTIATSANGNAVPGAVGAGGAVAPSIETFNLVVPSGAGNADATTGAGPFQMTLDYNAQAGVTLTLTDNFGNVILAPTPAGVGINVSLRPNTTGIRVTITNTTANPQPFNASFTVPGTADNIVKDVASASSTSGDPNNTAPSNPNTTVTNTSIEVGRPAPASSSNNPLNVIKQ